jgi:amino acid adenylation domain-containing protein
MNDLSLIIDLLRRGFQLSAHGNELRFRANKGELMATERERLAHSKPDIIAFLGPDRKHVRASFAQQRIWFSNQLEAGSPTYNGSASQFGIRGTLDDEAFERAINRIAERHEVLRTQFTSIVGQIVQIVAPHSFVALERIDLSGLSETVRTGKLDALTKEIARRPFNLQEGPLWRAVLIRLSDAEHFFVLSMHHVISDGWSVGIFLQELAKAYESERTGNGTTQPPLEVQYGDYARWQAQWEGAEAWEESLRFWRQHLGNNPPVLELPFDRPRPAEPSNAGASLTVEMPAGIVARARELAREERTTFFMVLMTAFQAALHRFSGQAAFQVGTPTSGRTPETEHLIGAFINMMAIHADFTSDPSFRTALRRVQQDLLAATEYQDTPFEELVRELKPARTPGVTPIFQTMLVFRQEAKDELLEFGGLTFSKPIEVCTGTSKYDLTLSAVLDGNRLNMLFEYKTEVFEEATIQRFAGHVTNLLEHACQSPDTDISQLRVLNDIERRMVLQDWQGPAVEYPSDATLHGMFEAQAAQTPDRIAVKHGDKKLTYAELDGRANGLARVLVANGAGPDTLVGVYMERSVELVIALYAVLKAGAAYVPLDPGYPEARLAYMLDDSHAPVVLTQRALAGSLPGGYGGRVILADEQTESADSPPDVRRDPAQLAYVIYTSGSTGQPKGVMIEHRAIANRIFWMQDAFKLDDSDRVLQKTPFSFDVSVWEFFWPLTAGARLVMAEPDGHKDPVYLASTIESERITTIHFVPSMLQAFLDAADTSRCGTLRRVICSGEALGVALHDQFFTSMACELHNLYGPTEAAVDVTHWPCAPKSERYNVPIGRPIANTQTYVLDAHKNPVPVGVPGELYLGGVQLARGYWRNPGLTAERFVPDPFSSHDNARLYRTGDRCRWRGDGTIEFLGRLDAQVKVRGFRIEPGEIESVLRAHTDIHQAAVDMRHLSGESQLVAYYVAEHELPAADLRKHALDNLPDYMVPQAFVFVEAMPLSPSGKLDRNALPEPANLASAARYVAPRNDTEEALAELWQTLLQIDRVGVYDNFFELGGHSLLLTQLASRVRDVFSIDIPLQVLFDASTIDRMAVVVMEAQLAAEDPDAVNDLLEQIQGLSPEEVQAMLESNAE